MVGKSKRRTEMIARSRAPHSFGVAGGNVGRVEGAELVRGGLPRLPVEPPISGPRLAWLS